MVGVGSGLHATINHDAVREAIEGALKEHKGSTSPEMASAVADAMTNWANNIGKPSSSTKVN
jgi:hypothetical protein